MSKLIYPGYRGTTVKLMVGLVTPDMDAVVLVFPWRYAGSYTRPIKKEPDYQWWR